MIKHSRNLIRPATLGALLITVLAALPSAVTAQVTTKKNNSANRWGTGEFYLGASYASTGDARLDYAPVDLKFDDSWGFLLGGGYHLSDNLYIGGEMSFSDTGFTGYGKDPETGEESFLKQDLREWGILAGVEYNILKGPVTPYISAGLGLTYLETPVPDSDPILICNPGYWQWWCYWAYPVYSEWAFTYYAGAGIRWDINDRTVLRLSYKSNWIDASSVQSSPRQDVVSLTVGGRF